MLIFHIATDADWRAAAASGSYTTSTYGVGLEEEGFIHLSRDSQAAGVLMRYYADVSEPLTLLTVDTDLVTSPWQFDDVPGAALSFPMRATRQRSRADCSPVHAGWVTIYKMSGTAGRGAADDRRQE